MVLPADFIFPKEKHSYTPASRGNMFFDKNESRARALEKKDPVKYRDKIQQLRSKQYWFIRYWVKGKPHDEKCPPEYQSRSGAMDYYKIVAGKTVTKTHLIPCLRKTTIADMCVFFLEYREKKAKRSGKKGGYAAAKSICKHLSHDIGKYTFERCRENPGILQDWIDDLPETHPGWSSKTIWNVYKELKAVFSVWIKKRLLQVPNPMNAVEEPDPLIKVIDYVPSQEDYNRIITTGAAMGIRPDVLRLIGAVRYTGFRIGEVLQWKCEYCILNPNDGGLPYIWVEISKQHRKTRVPRPIRSELVSILREQIGTRTEGPVWLWKNPPYKLLRINGEYLYKKAGVRVPRPFHDFRKTVKLELRRVLFDSKKAREYQGHKTESMDDYYTWFQREDLEEAVRYSYLK